MKIRILLLFSVVAACAIAVVQWKSITPAPVNGPDEISTEPVSNESPGPGSLRMSHRRPVVADPQIALPLSREEFGSSILRLEQMLTSTNLEMQELAMTNLLPALVLCDPLAAGRFAETNTLMAHEELLQRTARLLASQDPTNAIAWASSLQRDYERESAMTDVCLQIAETNPPEAVRLRESLLSENQGFDALQDLMQKWAEKDLAAAQAWIAAHPRDERRDQVIGRVAYVRSQTDPPGAAWFVIENMMPGDAQVEAAVSVLHQWGKQDLAAATTWASSFPDGPLRTRALQELSTINPPPQ